MPVEFSSIRVERIRPGWRDLTSKGIIHCASHDVVALLQEKHLIIFPDLPRIPSNTYANCNAEVVLEVRQVPTRLRPQDWRWHS